MAYTMAQFIAQAAAGGAVSLVTAVGVPAKLLLDIGGVPLELDEGVPVDLGLYFTAKDILDSISLRRAIIAENVVATAGTTALSREPVV